MNYSAQADTETSFQNALGHLRELWKEHKFLFISARTGKARSIPQNSISHKWYEQIHRELREHTVLQVKAFCKLHYGVPILRAECPEFRGAYDSRIRTGFTYEQKLILMESFPVTSLMDKKQLSQYLEAMQKGYLDRGVILEFPNEA